MKNALMIFTVFFLVQYESGYISICDSIKCAQEKLQSDYYRIEDIVKFEDGLIIKDGKCEGYDLTKRKANKLKIKRVWSAIIDEN